MLPLCACVHKALNSILTAVNLPTYSLYIPGLLSLATIRNARYRSLPALSLLLFVAPSIDPTIPADSTVLPLVERRAVLPAGFRAGGQAIGIKASGRPDLALVVTTAGPAAAAAVFTPNAFAAAPVLRSKANLAATSGDPAVRPWAS